MSKGTYQAVDLNEYLQTSKVERFEDMHLIAGIDVAKQTQFVCLMGSDWRDYDIVRFEAYETKTFVQFLNELPCDVSVVLEPSGTYGDPLREQCRKLGLEVRFIRPKQVHDAAEVFDGVPSLHDAKAAYLICRLHQNGVSQPWRELDETRRKMRAVLARLDEAELERQRMTGKLEAMLSRHWPELLEVLKLDSATLQKLLGEFGGPAGVAARPDQARRLMRRVGGTKLAAEKVAAVVASASSTRGMPMLAEEEKTLAEFAQKLYAARAKKRAETRNLEPLCEDDEEASHMAAEIGLTTACVVISYLGSVANYSSASAYQKAGGLNLKEKSSGKHKGQLKITKRGSAVVRRYLWLAAMRMITKHDGCKVARAWYEERKRRNGGNSGKGLVALMRKLISALYHIGHGEAYDATKLFDVSRLDVTV